MIIIRHSGDKTWPIELVDRYTYQGQEFDMPFDQFRKSEDARRAVRFLRNVRDETR